ncbi:hypothetical protein NPIL_319811, partial [Nephila pilipes]
MSVPKELCATHLLGLLTRNNRYQLLKSLRKAIM